MPSLSAFRRPFVTAALGSIVLSAAFSGCTTNPTTGRPQLPGISRNEEVSIGLSEAPKLTQEFGGEVQDPDLRAYITEIGMRLKDHSDFDARGNRITDWKRAPPGSQRTWVFTLLDSDVINAFALPGERVFMSRGLADKMTNEAQLAGVLGHEIGHVMARHTSERIGQAQLGQGVLTIGGIFAGGGTSGQIAMQGGQLLIGGTLLKFSRDQEREADQLGMRYMSLAGYNPRGQMQVMEILKAASGGSSTPEILATHPLPQTRIDDINGLLRTEYAHTQSGPQAAQFQFHEDRFKQRYLSIRQRQGLRSDADTTPRRRLLANVVLEDPMTWCLVCIEQAEHAQHAKAAPR